MLLPFFVFLRVLRGKKMSFRLLLSPVSRLLPPLPPSSCFNFDELFF